MAHPLNSLECPNIYSTDSSKSSPDVKDTIYNSFQSPLEVEIDIMSNVEEVEMSLTKGIANIQQRLDSNSNEHSAGYEESLHDQTLCFLLNGAKELETSISTRIENLQELINQDEDKAPKSLD
jgi:hypothetical protein